MNKRLRWHARRTLPTAALVTAALALVPAYVRAYTVAGASAVPTLLLGERAWVNFAAYDIRFPYTGRVLFARADPRLGDLVQVESPDDGRLIFKRVVALPGDRVGMHAHHLSLNARPLAYAPRDAGAFAAVPPENSLGSCVEAELIGEVRHLITYTPGPGANGSFPDVLVPAGHYYLLGDNRDHSLDSRAWGPVSRDHIRGRVISTPARR